MWRRWVLPKSLKKLAPPTGIEPAARGLGNRCSIRLSYGGMKASVGTFCGGSKAGLIAAIMSVGAIKTYIPVLRGIGCRFF